MMTKAIYLWSVLLIAMGGFSCAPVRPNSSSGAPTSRPAEVRRGMLMSGNHAQRTRQYYQQLLARIEPSGHGDARRLGVYLDFFKREFIREPRLFAFNVTADADWARRLTLRGFIEYSEQRQALESFLSHLGFTIAHDDVEILPSKNLGELRFAVVTAPSAFVYDRATGKRRETLTQCLHGDALFLLKQADDGQFLCHAADGYVGYIASDAIKRVDAKTFIQQQSAQPDSHAGEIKNAIATARTFLGTKYVWGGLTHDGVDCSGMVHASFASIGLDLARDADQQALTGRMVATRWCRGGLRAGDTLYFLSRRGTIHHTALYIGDDKFIEATEPKAKISSLDPRSPDYSAKRDHEFCFAKRILK
jgi:cell wall-associated NlpC family hydrolase